MLLSSECKIPKPELQGVDASCTICCSGVEGLGGEVAGCSTGRASFGSLSASRAAVRFLDFDEGGIATPKFKFFRPRPTVSGVGRKFPSGFLGDGMITSAACFLELRGVRKGDVAGRDRECFLWHLDEEGVTGCMATVFRGGVEGGIMASGGDESWNKDQ